MIILRILSILLIVSALIGAAVIAADLRRRPQPMRIMNAVWILTGLWAGVAGLWAYFSFGRAGGDSSAQPDKKSVQPIVSYPLLPETDCGPRLRETVAAGSAKPETPSPRAGMAARATAPEHQADGSSGPMQMGAGTAMETTSREQQGTDMKSMPGMRMPMIPARPKWQRVTLSTLHCGAGCTLADLLGEWFAVLVPVSIGGSLLAGSWVLDYALALVIGIGFQYAAIRGMESISPAKAIGRAAQADILSLTAWQIGMYGWMALVHFVFFPGNPPQKTSWTFWFMMQLAMGFGFAASYPMNSLLIRLGIKKAM